MAIKESALAAITSITQSDLVRAVTAAGASRRITVANLAKAIIENYTGSSLAGTSQSVKSALDSLNSKKLDLTDAKQLRFANISSSSADTIEELGVGDTTYGSYVLFMRIDSGGDGSYAAFVRHNSLGYQISEIYKGTHAQTPFVDSNGIVKTSSTTPMTIHAFMLRLSLWN